jgi:hypothetical protein
MVLAVAVLLRALPLTVPPFLSSDIYRYVWDGRVQAAGINPYRYVPADPALAALRDTAVYPHINRAEYARTIYPPAAQLVFAAVARVWDSMTGMRLAMVGFEAMGIVCALLLLKLAALPRERVLIYAWNPLPVWSIASDGHVDALVVGLVGLVLLLCARHRDAAAGAVLAAATLVKFFPLVLAAAILTAMLAAVAMVAVSPHYHWYFAWLALPAVLAPSRAVLWLATVPLLLVIGPIPGDQFLWRALVYGPALVLAFADRRHALSPPVQAVGDIACPLRSP